MPLTGRQRKDALAAYPPRRRPWRISLAGVISLLIHVIIGVFLFVTIRHEGQPELLPPPSAVTMLFESGRRNGPTLPEPGLQPTPPVPPAPETPSIEPSPPSPPLPSPPLPPSVQPPPQAPPPPTEAAPEIPPPSPIQPPPPRAEAVPPPAQAVPPPPAAEIAPVPLPPPEPKPSPAPKPTPARPPAKQPDFPAPMNFSLGTPHAATPSPARPRSAPHPPGTIDMSLGPASKGAADTTPFADRDQDAEGADWRNALSRWVAEHAYYPEQARRNMEEGDAKVHVIAEPSGRVKRVELIGKSGSMWLDLALLALFRDAHIPPLPSGEREPIEFNFTMHYVLIRPR